MSPVLLAFLGLGALAASLVSWLAEIGCRDEIERAEPAFAQRLFRSAGDQFLFGTGPVRVGALFFNTPPDSIRSSINLLRWVCGAQAVALVALGGCLAGMVLSDVIAH